MNVCKEHNSQQYLGIIHNYNYIYMLQIINNRHMAIDDKKTQQLLRVYNYDGG